MSGITKYFILISLFGFCWSSRRDFLTQQRGSIYDYYASYDYSGQSGSVSTERPGTPTSTEEHPYIALIEVDSRQRCWGSMISRSWVLTTASCTTGTPSKEFTVRVGFTSMKDGQTRPVQRKFEHPEFDAMEKSNDIALLRLLFKISLYSFKKIRLATKPIHEADSGTAFYLSSEFCPWEWCGERAQTVEISALNVTVAESSKCTNSGGWEPYHEQDLCLQAAVESNHPQHCGYENTGFPFIAHGRIYGIFRGGNTCALGYFTNITEYHTYIQATTGIKP